MYVMELYFTCVYYRRAWMGGGAVDGNEVTVVANDE